MKNLKVGYNYPLINRVARVARTIGKLTKISKPATAVTPQFRGHRRIEEKGEGSVVDFKGPRQLCQKQQADMGKSITKKKKDRKREEKESEGVSRI